MLTNSPALPSYQSKCPAQPANTTHTRQQPETVHNTHPYTDVETRGLHVPVLRGGPRRTRAPGELGIASSSPQARPSSLPRYTASMACGEHRYLQGQDVLLRPRWTCQIGVLRLLISPASLNTGASTRRSAENHETTLIRLGIRVTPSRARRLPIPRL